MTRRRLEIVLWALVLAFAAAGWARWRHALPSSPAAATGLVPPSPLPAAPVPGRELAAALRAIAQGDPFRLDRAPAPLGFAVQPPPGMPPPPPAPPPYRPALVLAGIVGPPWEALLEGVPGREGAVVVRAGDRLDRLRVISVTPTQAVIQGADTTWHLSLKQTWQ